MDVAGRLAILNNAMKWNLEQARTARVLKTTEGHLDHDRYMANARAILSQIQDLERKYGIRY
jgi:hypothetical protein